MPELLAAVNHLSQVVERLERRLAEDYPKRTEIERLFVTEIDSKRRRNSAVLLTIIFVLIAVFISYMATISTISTCFLGNAQNGRPPGICSVLPGYDHAQVRNRSVLKEFRHLIDLTEQNNRDINRLQKSLKRLRNGG